MPTVVVGGNAVDVHLKGVVPGRDFPLEPIHDIRNAEPATPARAAAPRWRSSRAWRSATSSSSGPSTPSRWGPPISTRRGTRPTSSWAATGSASTGSSPPPSRPAHDANGIIWPLALAPYHVLIVPLQVQNAAVMEQAAALESALTAAGLDVLVDDRDQRPGFKFKDADLIGIPLRVVVGERGLKEGKIEIKWRARAGGEASPGGHGRPGDPRRGRRDAHGGTTTGAPTVGAARAAARPS